MDARKILVDEVKLIGYYSTWSSTFGGAVRRRRRLPLGAAERARTSIGWAALVLFLAVSLVVAYSATNGLLDLIITPPVPGGLELGLFG